MPDRNILVAALAGAATLAMLIWLSRETSRFEIGAAPSGGQLEGRSTSVDLAESSSSGVEISLEGGFVGTASE